MKNQISTIKEQVKYCLENHVAARNSDAILYQILAKKFYGVDLTGITELPSMEGISRARRHFQAQGQYLAEDDVIVARAEIIKDYEKEYSPKRKASGF